MQNLQRNLAEIICFFVISLDSLKLYKRWLFKLTLRLEKSLSDDVDCSYQEVNLSFDCFSGGEGRALAQILAGEKNRKLRRKRRKLRKTRKKVPSKRKEQKTEEKREKEENEEEDADKVEKEE